jgi:hypothetical protein
VNGVSNPKASLALALTVVLWATAFPAIRVGLDGYGVAGLSLMRLAVASAALAVAAPLLRVRRPRVADLPLIAVCGVTGMSAYQLLLNWGEVHVPAGTASLLVSTAPVFSVMLAAAFLGWNRAKETVAPWWAENSKEAYSSGLANLATGLGNWHTSRPGIAVARRFGSRGLDMPRQFPGRLVRAHQPNEAT